MKIEEIIESINDYFGDMNRTKQETLDGLEKIYTELEGMMSSLEAELDNNEEE